MTDLPRVAIVLVTYARTEYAVRTVESVCKNLIYPDVGWYIGDDGSSPEHMQAIMDVLEKHNAPIISSHSEDFVPGKRWPGKSWNKAWEFAHSWSPVVLFLEDDWELRVPLDITPYVRLLIEKPDVGMIRLGHMAIGLDCYSVGHSGIHYLKIQPSTPYQFSGNPSLRHKRFAEFYGPYLENVGPGDTEVTYDATVRSKNGGPEIWWPINLPGGGWGVFSHIGQKQSY
jgi:hypothetical protein